MNSIVYESLLHVKLSFSAACPVGLCLAYKGFCYTVSCNPQRAFRQIFESFPFQGQQTTFFKWF